MSVIRPSPYILSFSLIFSQQEDKSELQGATLNFLPGLRPSLRRIVYLQIHRSFRENNHLPMLPFGYFYQLLLLYMDFSISRLSAFFGFPLSYRFPSRYPIGLFPHCGRLLLHPEGLCFLKQTVLRYVFLLIIPSSLNPSLN